MVPLKNEPSVMASYETCILSNGTTFSSVSSCEICSDIE